MKRKNIKEGSHKDYAYRVQDAVNELRGKVYHSFCVRVSREQLMRAAEKHNVSYKKLESITKVIDPEEVVTKQEKEVVYDQLEIKEVDKTFLVTFVDADGVERSMEMDSDCAFNAIMKVNDNFKNSTQFSVDEVRLS